MTIFESSREMSTGTLEARCLAAAGSAAIAYLVALYYTDLDPFTPSTRTWPAALASRTRGSGPAESMESLATLVPEMLSLRDLQRRTAATASSARSSTASNKSSGDTREGRPRSLSDPVGACPPGVCARRDSSSSLKLIGDLHQNRHCGTRP